MVQHSDEKGGAMTTLAIDIGGTKLAAALIGADGQIRDRRELPTPASQTPEALRDALSALVMRSGLPSLQPGLFATAACWR